MIPIATAAATFLNCPAPVILFDTCSLLDLFRPAGQKPRVPAGEIRSAAEILRLVIGQPDAAHLVVPELVPGEYADHADRIEKEFKGWFRIHDENQEWLAEAALWIGHQLPAPQAIQQFCIQAGCRRLADDLLSRSIVLERDPPCLERAIARLIAKRRPSHEKEIKDSMNLEQSLELSRRLSNLGYAQSRVFVSSNTNDFAAANSTAVHPDLKPELLAVGLEYFTSLRAALGALRAKGQLP